MKPVPEEDRKIIQQILYWASKGTTPPAIVTDPIETLSSDEL